MFGKEGTALDLLFSALPALHTRVWRDPSQPHFSQVFSLKKEGRELSSASGSQKESKKTQPGEAEMLMCAQYNCRAPNQGISQDNHI